MNVAIALVVIGVAGVAFLGGFATALLLARRALEREARVLMSEVDSARVIPLHSSRTTGGTYIAPDEPRVN